MQSVAAPSVGGGRATHRGGGEPRPGGTCDVSAVSMGLESLEFEARGQSTRRRGALLYLTEPNTKPSHIDDKRGTVTSVLS